MSASSYGPGAWLKARFSFKGRASRREYWLHTLAALVLFFAVATIIVVVTLNTYVLLTAHAGTPRPGLARAVLLAAPLLFMVDFGLYFWAVLAATTRRNHDLDRPLFGGVSDFLSLRCLTTRGTIGPNQYGPDPLQNFFE
jgi:uncharacterized membrane protein YhaH (DUF805 family)